MTSSFLCAGVVLPAYTRVRVPDDHAIADLAMYNYVEVRTVPTMVNRWSEQKYRRSEGERLLGGLRGLEEVRLTLLCLLDASSRQLQVVPLQEAPGQPPVCRHAKDSHSSLYNGEPHPTPTAALTPQTEVSVIPPQISQGHFPPSQVTFTRTPYHEAVERWHWQNKVKRHGGISPTLPERWETEQSQRQ